MEPPRVQYAVTPDGVTIAYTTFGEGPPLMYMGGPPFTHIQREWQILSYRFWNEHFASRFQVIRYDARGNGMSQREVAGYTLDALVLDMEAVLDRVGIEKLALLAVQGSGLVAIEFALRHPERVSHLVLWDSYANGGQFLDIPQTRALEGVLTADWEMFTETLGHSIYAWQKPELSTQAAAFFRECVTQQTAQEFFNLARVTDLTPRLAELRCPALVMQHRTQQLPSIDIARQITAHIANASLLVLDGSWDEPGEDAPNIDRAFDDLFGRPTAPRRATMPSGGLVTILFTDIADSTSLTQRLGDAKAQDLVRAHNTIVRDALAAHSGTEIKHTGDGIMASFPTTTGALECASTIQHAVEARGDPDLAVHIGLNAGEPVMEEHDLFGTSVQLARRICDQAGAGDVLVSDVVRQLSAGKGYLFADRGEVALRGFEDPVRIYELRWRDGPS